MKNVTKRIWETGEGLMNMWESQAENTREFQKRKKTEIVYKQLVKNKQIN